MEGKWVGRLEIACKVRRLVLAVGAATLYRSEFATDMKTIPQRELRNRISAVLREVEAGERVRITVGGKPVADLVPIDGVRRTFVPRDQIVQILTQAPLDRRFAQDIEDAVGATIDEI
jgi:prevent-host-death family protein